MTDTAQQQELWGGETRKAVANFPVSGEPIPVAVRRWLGRIKAAAARANAELGLLDAEKAERIAAAGDRIAAGELDDQFPIDVYQTGSGTSSNMNANEVIATLAGDDVHANDHDNMGQSSNDDFPAAVHLAAQVIGNDTAIAVGGLQGHFELNVFIPLMARNLLQSIALLASASRLLAEKCVNGIEANREQCERYAELTLSAATALNPYIGYDKATEIVKEAASSGRSLREVAREAGVDEETLDKALDYRAMARPHDAP